MQEAEQRKLISRHTVAHIGKRLPRLRLHTTRSPSSALPSSVKRHTTRSATSGRGLGVKHFVDGWSTTLTWNVLQLSSPCALRLRHSQLEDGGGGALVVGVSEEALGAVIELVVLEAASNNGASRSGESRNGAHACEAARHCRAWTWAWSMTAWQNEAWQSMGICQDTRAEHGHARAGPLWTAGHKKRHTEHVVPCSCAGKGRFTSLRNGQTYEILVSEAVTERYSASGLAMSGPRFS